MFKVSDLKMVIKHMEDNDITEFDLDNIGRNYQGPYSLTTVFLKLVTTNYNYTLTRTDCSAIPHRLPTLTKTTTLKGDDNG